MGSVGYGWVGKDNVGLVTGNGNGKGRVQIGYSRVGLGKVSRVGYGKRNIKVG